MRFQGILAEKAAYPVSMMCHALRVSTAGYYAWKRRPLLSPRAERDLLLAVRITEIFREHRKRYGVPRIHAQLAREGIHVSAKRVGRIMRKRGMKALHPRRHRCTTDSSHKLPIAPNVLARNFAPGRPHRAWVGDITYLRTREGWLYLAVLIDIGSRAVVGWATGDSLEAELAIRTLQMALENHRPPRGIVHHTDRGSQYASKEYRALLSKHGIRCSMSRRANCWDNAVAESFFATVEKELQEDIPATREIAHGRVFAFIEGYYNRKRLHSSLGYRTPAEALEEGDGQ
jgi:transposase InsO family protein